MTDTNVLVAQLNLSGTDLPRALVTWWIAYIQLFDFEVQNVLVKDIRQQMDFLGDPLLRPT